MQRNSIPSKCRDGRTAGNNGRGRQFRKTFKWRSANRHASLKRTIFYATTLKLVFIPAVVHSPHLQSHSLL